MSKFKDILSAAKQREDESTSEKKSTVKTVEGGHSQAPAIIAGERVTPSRGRPPGKRSNPDYEQVTAYIKKDTYRKTKIALLEQQEKQEFSELVEFLLSEWLSTQKSKNTKA